MKINVRINSLTPGEATRCCKVQAQSAARTPRNKGLHIGNVKAIASANLDDCFAVKNIRVIEGKNGLFVSMPSYKGADGEYHDLCFPTTSEMRKQLNNAVSEAYKQAIIQLQEQSNANFQQSEQMSESAPTMSM